MTAYATHLLQPDSPRATVADSYSLLVIAEGFTQEDDFVQHCLEMRESLLSRTPYNLLRVYPGPFSVYYAFTPSNVPGPALGTVPGDTCLRSTYDLTTGQLRIDNSALAAALLKITGAPSSLYGNWTAVRGLDLLVLLPDSAGGQAISATLEQVGSPMVTTAFVATTVDGDLWYQVPMRMISLGLGLEDEAEDPAPAPASPTGDQAQTLAYRPNVILKSAAPIGPPTAQFKWYDDLSPAQRTRALNVVPFGGTSSSTDPIQLFEGAAGFRSDVYRSATDCLMRRRPAGTGVYSLKGHEVALCVICERHLNRIVRGTWALRGKRTLRTQQLKFDEVQTWATSDGATGSAIRSERPVVELQLTNCCRTARCYRLLRRAAYRESQTSWRPRKRDRRRRRTHRVPRRHRHL